MKNGDAAITAGSIFCLSLQSHKARRDCFLLDAKGASSCSSQFAKNFTRHDLDKNGRERCSACFC